MGRRARCHVGVTNRLGPTCVLASDGVSIESTLSPRARNRQAHDLLMSKEADADMRHLLSTMREALVTQAVDTLSPEHMRKIAAPPALPQPGLLWERFASQLPPRELATEAPLKSGSLTQRPRRRTGTGVDNGLFRGIPGLLEQPPTVDERDGFYFPEASRAPIQAAPPQSPRRRPAGPFPNTRSATITDIARGTEGPTAFQQAVFYLPIAGAENPCSLPIAAPVTTRHTSSTFHGPTWRTIQPVSQRTNPAFEPPASQYSDASLGMNRSTLPQIEKLRGLVTKTVGYEERRKLANRVADVSACESARAVRVDESRVLAKAVQRAEYQRRMAEYKWTR